MHNLSMSQALSIWSDLEQCYAGINKFGGNIAELYAYRFLSNNPSAKAEYLESSSQLLRESAEEHFSIAAKSLLAILEYFCLTKNCKAFIEKSDDEWSPIGNWIKDIKFCHRIHVKITPNLERDLLDQHRNMRNR